MYVMILYIKPLAEANTSSSTDIDVDVSIWAAQVGAEHDGA